MGGEKRPPRWQSKSKKGSPPRGRGKEPNVSLSVAPPGITPAWAGKSRSIWDIFVIIGDHPRVGGEKHRRLQNADQHQGSPPRGRGKGNFVHLADFMVGITPAWAGKRGLNPALAAYNGDHPRVGGEKHLADFMVVGCPGSPPRGRGKESGRVNILVRFGITPAWAGKSCSEELRFILYEDHPRVGGEKCGMPLLFLLVVGSPPRGRGKEVIPHPRKTESGITPAWAGKS